MLLREYACIKSWIGDELISSTFGETPAARTPDQLRVTFQWRSCLMKLSICRADDSLLMIERMPGTYGSYEISRKASELFQRCSCSRPPELEMADNCSRWARSDLIITGYWSKIPMMRMVPWLWSKTEIWRPSEWLGLFGWKPLMAAHVPLQQSLSYTG